MHAWLLFLFFSHLIWSKMLLLILGVCHSLIFLQVSYCSLLAFTEFIIHVFDWHTFTTENAVSNFSFLPNRIFWYSVIAAKWNFTLEFHGNSPTVPWKIMQILKEHLINHLGVRGMQLMAELASVGMYSCVTSHWLHDITTAPGPWKSWGWLAEGIGCFCQS